jgi:2-amino-4-hydroxy-6-hydroxymethyldihydropteridine diphosphokinase
MVQVYLSLGSNIQRERHITAALEALSLGYGSLAVSSVYESESVGFCGDHFFNLVVGIETEKTVCDLSAELRHIEQNNGRDRSGPKFSSRTLDIDILTYGESAGMIDGVLLPRDEITKNAFVLLPLSEIAAKQKHPVLNVSYEQLWQDFDKTSQRLWPVDFYWRDKLISKAG